MGVKLSVEGQFLCLRIESGWLLWSARLDQIDGMDLAEVLKSAEREKQHHEADMADMSLRLCP